MNPSVIERHWQKRADRAALSALTAHHFDAQREFYRPRKKSLRAALCSRRAGKTRGGNESDVELAAQTRDGRFLYVNETRAEAKRLAWHGARGDGMMSLVRDLGWIDSGRAVPNESELTIRFPAINSWIFLIGVDDDAAIRKALGTPWNRVRWDEAQRIPSKFTTTIRETMLVALLDYGGEFLMTGTAERRMSGMFYDVTRNDSKLTGWDVHRWTMIQNPFWGRAKQINGQWFTVWSVNDEVVSGPHEPEQLQAAILAARHLTGVLGLQELLMAPMSRRSTRRSCAGLRSPSGSARIRTSSTRSTSSRMPSCSMRRIAYDRMDSSMWSRHSRICRVIGQTTCSRWASISASPTRLQW